MKRAFARETKEGQPQEGGTSWDRWDYGTFPLHDDPIGKRTLLQLERDSSQHAFMDPLWSAFSDEDVQRGLSCLQPFASVDRQKKFADVLGGRTDRLRFVFENPSNANNVWAALRTFDAFGLQLTDIITNNAAYISDFRRGTMGAALGSQKWLTLREHGNTTDCLTELRASGHLLLCTDLHSTSLALPDVDWTGITKQNELKVAIVMGNEKQGISEEARRLADHLIHIPMRGFTESLNLSVACAVICANLQAKGVLIPGLSPSLKDRVLLTWLARSVRGSPAILRNEGIKVKGNRVYDTVGQCSSKP